VAGWRSSSKRGPTSRASPNFSTRLPASPVSATLPDTMLLDDVRTGRAGVRFAIPPHLEVADHGHDAAPLRSSERGVGWHLSRHAYHLDLKHEHHALLVRDVERHTRALFERYSGTLRRGAGPFAVVPLRTKDPAWSPVVSVERVQLAGHPARSPSFIGCRTSRATRCSWVISFCPPRAGCSSCASWRPPTSLVSGSRRSCRPRCAKRVTSLPTP
jgi:hypothetical protein